MFHETPLTGDSHKLDFLRTIAVSLVVGAHIFVFFGDPVYFKYFQPGLLGPLGVVLFFVHTSLVLMLSIERQLKKWGTTNWLSIFYLRRAFRIYPLSIVTVLAIYFLAIPAGRLEPYQLLPLQDVDLLTLIANLTLTQNFMHEINILGPLWSLPFEMQMYLLLPFCYLIARKVKSIQSLHALWAIFALVAFIFVPRVFKFNDAHYWQIPPFILYLPCFWAGIIAYRAHSEQKANLNFKYFPFALICLCVLFMLSYDKMKYIFMALICGTLLPHLKEPSNKLLIKSSQIVAKYSYGVYLFHYISIWLAFSVCKDQPMLLQWVIFTVSLVGICWAAFHFIEKPLIAVGNKFAEKLARK